MKQCEKCYPFFCINNKYNFRTGVTGVFMSALFLKIGSAKLNNPGHSMSICTQMYNYQSDLNRGLGGFI